MDVLLLFSDPSPSPPDPRCTLPVDDQRAVASVRTARTWPADLQSLDGPSWRLGMALPQAAGNSMAHHDSHIDAAASHLERCDDHSRSAQRECRHPALCAAMAKERDPMLREWSRLLVRANDPPEEAEAWVAAVVIVTAEARGPVVTEFREQRQAPLAYNVLLYSTVPEVAPMINGSRPA